MLDVKFIRENTEVVQNAINNKRYKIKVEDFIGLDAERRQALTELERLKNEKNQESDKIAKLMAQKQNAKDIIDKMKSLSQKIAEIEPKMEEIDKKYNDFVYRFPNIPHESVPVSTGPEGNKEVKKWGDIPNFDFQPKSQMELGANLNILDFGRAAKISGSGFALYKGR